ncbi:MAG: PD-(D/E)XK nuclease family protein [Planctomycetes bacterium]|nr:PD-(D/E)XK nuclease family protein [Planctomycetota bacterium]
MRKDHDRPAAPLRFLPASEPLAALARELLTEASPTAEEFDLSADTIVVPGARARRRLLVELSAAAHARGLRLVPPRLVGVGGIESELGEPRPRPLADETQRVLALHAALIAQDGAATIAQAQQLLRLRRELAAARLGLDAVAAAADAADADGDRYRRLHDAVAAAGAALAAEGFDDPDAFVAEPASPSGRLHLVAVLDPSPKLREFLAAWRGEIVPWCVAEARHAARFDRLGALNVAAWSRLEVEVDLAVVRRVDDPQAQARAALELFAELAAGDDVPADAITLGLCDDALAAVVAREFVAQGLAVHDARGSSAVGLPPLRLLQRLREFLVEPTTRSLRRLAQLADLEPLLGTEGLRAFDRWRRHHHERATPKDWLRDTRGVPGLEALDARLRELAALLPDRGRLPEFAAPIAALLAKVLAREGVGAERGRVDAAIRALLDLLERCAATPPALCAELEVAGALEAIVALARDARIPDVPRDDALDLVGWLELPLDGARATLVVGFEDGAVPQSADDPLLPDALRRTLGLPDARARLARDRYVLATLLARGPVRFTLGRRDGRGEPRMPSALLLTGEGAALARRVVALTSEVEPPPAPVLATSRFRAPTPPPGPIAFDAIAVTAFKDYLACPYRFWLRHVLKLETDDPAGDALDDRSFGSVVHKVLEAYGREELAAFAEGRPRLAESALNARLEELLEVVLRERAGRWLGGGLRIQRQILRERLAWFARAHVEAPADLRPLAIEAKVDWEMPMDDGRPIRITGTFDRLEGRRGPAGWELRVLDYKTTRQGHEPDKAHRRSSGRGKSESAWLDLQLPLYERLVRAHASCLLGEEAPVVSSVEVGYFAIGESQARVGWFAASAVAAAVDEAVLEAKRIVTAIRAAEFAPNPQYRPREGDPLEILCRSAIAADDADEGEEDLAE